MAHSQLSSLAFWAVPLAMVFTLNFPVLAADSVRTPNVVILLADDLGYGDVGCYGSKTIRTPNIDRLAREGTRFTSFYVAQPVCTASRAALLTGCYSNRVSLFGALNHQSTVGLARTELLMPEMFKKLGYATAVYGKWHVGDRPPFRPLQRGFDEWLGLPYSNDNGPLHPTVKTLPPLPLYDGDRIVETNPDQRQFTRRFTDRAISFIEKNKDRPFFLYVPHVMPHVPIFASQSFQEKSGKGIYADVVEELDSGVGEVLAALQKHGLDDNTLVIFSSDNGPFLSYGSHAGSAGPLREGKLTTWDGGVRVPGLVRWPGKVPAGRVCETPVMTIDLLPTFAKLVGGELSMNTIDGKDIAPILFGERGAASPHEAYLFYAGDELHALRSGDWKLHLPHEYLTVNGLPGTAGKPANFANMKPESMSVSGLRGIASRHGYRVEKTGLALFNLRDDPGETTNVAEQNPQVLERMRAIAERARHDLGDSLTNRKGQGVRPCDEAK